MRALRHKIGQMLLVGFEGLHAPDYILDWLASGQIGGVILFSRNVSSPAQVAELTRSLHQAAREPILIAIDQEGGTVARLREGFTEAPSAMSLGVADSEVLAEQVAAALGEELRALGINLDLAPVVDLGHDSSNPVIGTRTFGVDEARVSQLACAQVRGYQKSGVAACAKHFPGHGNTPVDSHVSLPVITGPLDFLWEHDLVPFRATVDAGIASVMISHVKFEALDSEYPSTLSPAIITGLLRDEIGFEGLALTDCMEMKAITTHYGAGESAVLAALAGVDAMFFSHTQSAQQAAYDALLAAAESGRLPEARIDDAVARVDAFKQQYPAAPEARPLEVIRAPHHLDICRQGAEAGTVLLSARPDVFPLNLDDGRQIGLVEFASYMESGILDRGGLTGLGTTLQATAPHIEHVALNANAPRAEALDRARVLASEANILVLATRNAHLNPAQKALAQKLLDSARNTILICLRNPYDVEVLTGADAVLCTCGDGAPSLQAAVDALLGRFTPAGRLPVPIEGLPA